MDNKYLLHVGFCLALTCLTTNCYSQDLEPSFESPNESVVRFHEGLAEKDTEKAASALSGELYMFNGNFSNDPTEWQPHMYVAGQSIIQWVDQMIQVAGPHVNRVLFIESDIRNESAIVITQETGRNKFRSWVDERVVYFLGRNSNGWKIVGLYIRDLRNPE